MSANSTVARPYAKAVFELARDGGKLAAWSRLLAVSAAVVTDERMAKLLTSPHVTPEQLGGAVVDIVTQALSKDPAGELDQQGKNFLLTLAASRRLGVLAQIAAAYERLRAESENTVDVTVISAAPLDDRQREAYSNALKKRLRREVRLHAAVDPTLLGGAVLRADDLVIDGSLRGRLERLRSELTG